MVEYITLFGAFVISAGFFWWINSTSIKNSSSSSSSNPHFKSSNDSSSKNKKAKSIDPKVEERRKEAEKRLEGIAPSKEEWIYINEEELKYFKGEENERNPNGLIYICVCDDIFDVTSKPHFYGPGSSYNIFSGSDASRGLATNSLKESVFGELDKDWSTFMISHFEALDSWYSHFKKKYHKIGQLSPPSCSIPRDEIQSQMEKYKIQFEAEKAAKKVEKEKLKEKESKKDQ